MKLFFWLDVWMISFLLGVANGFEYRQLERHPDQYPSQIPSATPCQCVCPEYNWMIHEEFKEESPDE